MKLNGWLKNVRMCCCPPVCPLCTGISQSTAVLCVACEALLPHCYFACPQCAERLMIGQPCTRCAHAPIACDALVALYWYEPPVDFLMKAFKFHKQLYLGDYFAQKLAARIISVTKEYPEIMVPMPQSSQRFKTRDMHQSLLLARALSKRLDISLNITDCQKIRHIKTQASQPLNKRMHHVKGAFYVSPVVFKNRHVAIVDDVVTTGASVHELTKKLKEAGAKKVTVWSVCKTPHIDCTIR